MIPEDLEELMELAASTPDELLQEKLAGHEVDEVRTSLARNPHLVPRIQSILINDEDGAARSNLGSNPATTPEIQMRLADWAYGVFLGALADNPQVCYEVQDRIVKSDSFFFETLLRNSGINPRILRDLWDQQETDYTQSTVEYLSLALPHPSLPRDVIEEAVRSDKFATRLCVATNPNLTPAEQWTLAQDASGDVRAEVACNEKCPLEILEALAKDKYSAVRATVARREDLPTSLYQQLSFDDDDEVVDAILESAAVKCTPDFRARVVKMRNPGLYERITSEADAEIGEGLVDTWRGSLASLVEASRLVNR